MPTKKLRNPENPFDMSNRRVSILIKQISANQFLPQTENSGTEAGNLESETQKE